MTIRNRSSSIKHNRDDAPSPCDDRPPEPGRSQSARDDEGSEPPDLGALGPFGDLDDDVLKELALQDFIGTLSSSDGHGEGEENN